MSKIRISILILAVFIIAGSFWHVIANINQDKTTGDIRPYVKNPWYWEYNGEPIMLIGASDEDNPWQWKDKKLTDQLEFLTSVGGNYLRCTMSDRDEGNIFANKQLENGLYDLEQWNEKYWEKIRFFLEETQKRGIIVQLTLWDHFDLSGSNASGRFAIHPLNPENNINWESGTINSGGDYYGGSLSNNNQIVLNYQHGYIKKLVSVTFMFDHILYNINNESSLGAEWENYWARFIKDEAQKINKDIHVTSMQFAPGTSVRHVMTYSDIYSFAEVSQNNQDALGAVGKKHYENLIYWRDMIASGNKGTMPINNEKVYGQGLGLNTAAGTQKEAIERFWRNIFGGAASTRFHRPALSGDGKSGWGIGLSEPARNTLKAVSMFLEEFDIFNAIPYEGCKTAGSSIDADYCLADIGKIYAVYFPTGRTTVHLDPWVYVNKVSVQRLDIESLEWSEKEMLKPNWDQYDGIFWWGPQRIITLTPPNGRSYVYIIKVIE